MAAQLSNLPAAYSILHDLKMPGSKGNIDHVVIGPGGAFSILTCRQPEPLAFHDEQLWAGSASLKGDLDTARVEAQMLTQTLGTPVVPVIGILGSMVPPSVPSAIEGVLVCSADNIARVVSRASHTLLPATKVAEVAERILPLLNSPGTSPRVAGQPVARESYGDPSVVPTMPPPIGQAPEPAVSGREARRSVKSAADARRQTRRRGGDTPTKAAPRKERAGWARSAAFVAATIVSLCLVAFAVGSLVRVLFSEDNADGASGTTSSTSSTSLFVTPSTAPSSLLAPAVEFTPVCAAPGAGWELVPTWPGDLAAPGEYVVEAQGLDGSWVSMGAFSTPDAAGGTVAQQAPSVTWNLRIAAVLQDGTRGPATVTLVTTPAFAC
jgi:hypothetical protein